MVTIDTSNHNSCNTKHILPYNFNILRYLPEIYCGKWNWYVGRKYNSALNYLQILARVTAPVYYFTIVLYIGKLQ